MKATAAALAATLACAGALGYDSADVDEANGYDHAWKFAWATTGRCRAPHGTPALP